jgi:AraC family transcriptional activator of pobA
MVRARPIVSDDRMVGASPLAVARHSALDSVECTMPRRAPVTHSHAALAFYTGGRSRMELNGHWSVGEGDVLLVPAGLPHRMLERRRPEYWGLSFCVPCFAMDAAAVLLDPFEKVRDGASAIVHVPPARHEYLAGLFRELERLGHEPAGAQRALDAVQRSLLTLILNEIDRARTSASGEGGPIRAPVAPRALGSGRVSPGRVVVESLRFIERNCLRRLTLNEVAAAVGRNPTYVTSALTQATGRSAGAWIVSGRMAEARRLLLHSDEMVDIIAERVGYADATHFIRMFRREHGSTPAAWRAAQTRWSRRDEPFARDARK